MKSFVLFMSMLLVASIGVLAASDLDNPNPDIPRGVSVTAPSGENTVDNGDGTFTFTQTVDEQSTPPHYTAPASGGFEIYSWFDEDYGWQHTFPAASTPGVQILSAKLTVRAWDVDSEPSHGYDGEYDGIYGDGNFLNPQYLQGFDDSWSVTNFTINPGNLADGELDVFMDIDMHHDYDNWATTLDYSLMTIVYEIDGNNNPPYQPNLDTDPDTCPTTEDDLVVNVVGPSPADPDGDAVTYNYRWLVNAGTGNYIDDEFAGRGDHTGSTVPSADTQSGDKWRVEVTPVDEHGAHGTTNSVDFAEIDAEECNIPPVADAGQDKTACIGMTTLDGSGSYDVDGSIVAYKWEMWYNGSWVEIGTTESVDVDLLVFATYQFRLTVTDDMGATDDAIIFVEADAEYCDDVGIPEFGAIAAGAALLGAVGGFLILRRRR